MLDLASGGFASTPAGYFAGAGGITMLFLVPVMAWIFKRLVNELDTVKSALSIQSQALAVVVERLAPMQEQITLTVKDAGNLKERTAVLEHAMSTHEAWAQRTRDEMLRTRP